MNFTLQGRVVQVCTDKVIQHTADTVYQTMLEWKLYNYENNKLS